MAFDLEQVRAQTKGCKTRLHLDNCGSSLMPDPVVEAMIGHMTLEQQVGGYVAQERKSAALDTFYEAIARLLGGQAEDFAFTASAVDAWTRAFYSVPMIAGDNIITSYNEYCSNFLAYLHRKERDGIDIRVAEANRDGYLDPVSVADLIDGRTRLISISHVPSSSGQINPVEAIGDIAEAAGIPYLLDACQSIGQLSVRVDKIKCDMLAGTGRKFLRGPRGSGFLYISPQMRERLSPVMMTNNSGVWVGADDVELRSDTRVFEGWERSVSAQLGLTAALDYLQALGRETCMARTSHLAKRLRAGISAINNIVPTCPKGSSAAIITFCHKKMGAKEVKAKFESMDIAVQVASVFHTRLDLERRGLGDIVRVSPHYYNSEAEIDRFLNRLEAL